MKHPDDRFPIQSFLLIISIFTLIRIPKSLCQNGQYLSCGNVFQCGNNLFNYPFWGGNRPENCGYPGFEVTCVSNVFSRLTISSEAYLVIGSPDITANTVTVAREDLFNSNCPGDPQDTAMNLTIFSYLNTQNLTLSYGCPSSTPTRQNEFSCTFNGNRTSSYYSIVGSSGSNQGLSVPSGCDRSITVPVDQDAVRGLVNSASLSAVLMVGFKLRYEANNSNCLRCMQSNGRCGYDTDSGSFICYCSDSAYDRVCNGTAANTPGGNGGSRIRVWIVSITGIAVGISLLAVVIVIFYLAKKYSWLESIICWKTDKQSELLFQEFVRNFGSMAPKLYTYSEVRKMTNSFADKLGHGGFGCVYSGKLKDGRHVAVKVLNDNKGNGEDFINEVASISRTSHVNVVTLLGFSHNKKKRALIYEFMPNGSLDKFICKKESSQGMRDDHLEWKLLYKITVGIARGLEYLHQGCNTRIVHFDIKPQNILLDVDFCPKISDFGQARLYNKKESVMSTMTARGTIGYIAPEVTCRGFGGVSHKSDVYSYGMMVLEIVGLRRKPDIDHSQQVSDHYFPDWIYELVEVGKDLPLEGVCNQEEVETAMKMILVGLWCIQINPAERPSISKVVEMLEGSLQSIQIPPKPSLVSPAATSINQQESSTTSSIS